MQINYYFLILSDKPNKKVCPNTVENEGKAINAAIITRTITVQMRPSDSLEALILIH